MAEKKKRRFGLLSAWGLIALLCGCVFLGMMFASRNSGGTQNVSTGNPTDTEAAQNTDTSANPEAPEPTQTPEPTATSSVGIIAVPYEEGGIELTVLDAYFTNEMNDFLKPDEGFVYLVVEVMIKNIDREEAPYNPLYFSLNDAEGFEYNTTLGAPEPSLKSGTSAQGEITRGFIAFEVKEGATGLVIAYEPLVILGGYEPIRIALGDGLETK